MAHRDYIVHRGIYFQGVGGRFLIAGLSEAYDLFWGTIFTFFIYIFFFQVSPSFWENFILYIFDFLISNLGTIRHIFKPASSFKHETSLKKEI